MDQRKDISEFLRTRRDRITPDQAGIIGGGRRRVPGLRREEVAMLAGVSVEYYARMERGDLADVSPEVLDSLAQALQLDEDETDHLAALARAASPQPARGRKRPAEQTVRPSLQRFLDAVTRAPVWVRDRRMNFIAANPLGRALYAPILDDPANQANTARVVAFGRLSCRAAWQWAASASMAAARRCSLLPAMRACGSADARRRAVRTAGSFGGGGDVAEHAAEDDAVERRDGPPSAAITEHAEQRGFADSSIALDAIVALCLNVVTCSVR
jgi:transcriptional regulator with XRE-family HTH domain